MMGVMLIGGAVSEVGLEKFRILVRLRVWVLWGVSGVSLKCYLIVCRIEVWL